MTYIAPTTRKTELSTKISEWMKRQRKGYADTAYAKAYTKEIYMQTLEDEKISDAEY